MTIILQLKSARACAQKILNKIKSNFFVIGFLSIFWFLLRTGTKPSRVRYPCQKAAAANIYLWASIYILPMITYLKRKRNKIMVVLLVLLISIYIWSPFIFYNFKRVIAGPENISLKLEGHYANSSPSSNIYAVTNTTGHDNGLIELINLMGNNGLLFYKSNIIQKNQGPEGLISSDDVIIIKVNCQWDKRGGTNTDIVKGIIELIINHPDEFIGEIVVADNGQSIGSLDHIQNNAENKSQSVQDVVDMFSSSHNVSTYLWDDIYLNQTSEYAQGSMEDGYIVNSTRSQTTGILVSYPKFKTKFGTFISFKEGIWDPNTG